VTRQHLSQFLALTSWQRRFLIEAAVRLPIVDLRLRAQGLQKLRRKIEARGLGRASNSDADKAGTASQMANLVAIVSRHGLVEGTCLSRSLVLLWMLRRHEIEAELVVGIRRDDAKDGHAWVELGGQPLNASAIVSKRFDPFPAL